MPLFEQLDLSLPTGPALVVLGRDFDLEAKALDLALQDRFGKKYVASGGTATLDQAITKKFAKKELLLAKNLAVVKKAYEVGAEWAEKNQVELTVARV